MSKFPTEEQAKVLKNKTEKAIVSASAGTGKTTTLIQYIADLVQQGVPVNRMLVVTFTNNSANEMKERLLSELMELDSNDWILNQIDSVLTSDISTMHAFLQKIIKRNIDKLAISGSYYLLDESKGADIRNKAFDMAYEKACLEKDYQDFLLSLHSEKRLLKSIIFALERHLCVLANPDEALEFYCENQEGILKEATQRMNKILADKFYDFARRTDEIFNQMNQKDLNYKYIKNYISALQQVSSENTLKENIEIIKTVSWGKINNKEEIIGFAPIKEGVAKLVKKYKDKQFEKDSFWEQNNLVPKIYEFYRIYIEKLNEIKKNENCLDFNDLEKFAIELLQDKNIVEEIQKNYDYVIIDEYQDTNPVQEKIMKIISKNCKFLAVGDPKQGIYGFRNATSEIMKQDIRDFSPDGVYYLTSNFRSNSNILKFINDVFENIMLEDNTGIDYKSTSTFKISENSPVGKLPAVRIDLIDLKEEEKEEIIPAVYDIKKAERVIKDSAKEEAKVICQRINELVASKIYDVRQGDYRDVNYSDITILVRGRGAVADKIVQELILHEIPVISSLDKSISSNEEVEVIKSLLKLCVDYEDDVSLVGFLSSKLGGLSLDELYSLRQDAKDKAFFEEFKECEYFDDFNSKIEEFKLFVQARGIRSALENLFNKCDYESYLLSKKDGLNTKSQIDKFLDIIENSGYNFDVPGLLRYLNSNDIKIHGVNSGLNAVNVTTIHSSKGLEYPIVILAGMGKDLTKKDQRNGGTSFKISNKYGLAMSSFDYERGEKSKNILLTAIEEEKNRKEFIDEIMLLYVAMTRAKNHLYIVGEEKANNIRKLISGEDVFENKSFIKLILSSLLVKNSELLFGDRYKADNFELNIINEVKDLNIKQEKHVLEGTGFAEQIEKYLDYKYPHEVATKMRYKHSVTSINLVNMDKKYSGGGETAEVGTAYHTALEILDIEKINNIDDIKKGLDENLLSIIDPEILMKDIKILKPLILNKKIYKEKLFTMKINAREVLEDSVDENIMIQGIIDLFLIGEKNILIDYKYTNIKDEKILINKYKKQLFIYKKAIENAYMLRLDEIYLLSLKYGELIKIN